MATHRTVLFQKEVAEVAEQLLHNEGQKDHTEMDRRGRDVVLPNPHPKHSDPQVGEISQI